MLKIPNFNYIELFANNNRSSVNCITGEVITFYCMMFDVLTYRISDTMSTTKKKLTTKTARPFKRTNAFVRPEIETSLKGKRFSNGNGKEIIVFRSPMINL